jgi:phosphoesterase RecJ-like protein
MRMTDDLDRPPFLGRSAAFAAAAEVLSAGRNVWICTHTDPDGDAVGSLLGLADLLESAGARVTRACRDPVPEDFRYLTGADKVGAHALRDADVAVAVDCGDFARLGDLATPVAWETRPTVVLDHHRSNPGFGTVNVIAPEVSSTSEIVLELGSHLGVPTSTAAAEALLVGVITDTLGFRTSSTTIDTLANCAHLMALDASLPATLTRIYGSRPLSAIKLTARAVESLEVRGRQGLAVLTAGDLATLQERPEDTRGISSYLLQARELDVVAVVRVREPGACDVSMRSRRPIDLVPAALALGGGGHPQASGATVHADLDRAKSIVWDALAAIKVGQSDDRG